VEILTNQLCFEDWMKESEREEGKNRQKFLEKLQSSKNLLGWGGSESYLNWKDEVKEKLIEEEEEEEIENNFWRNLEDLIEGLLDENPSQRMIKLKETSLKMSNTISSSSSSSNDKMVENGSKNECVVVEKFNQEIQSIVTEIGNGDLLHFEGESKIEKDPFSNF